MASAKVENSRGHVPSIATPNSFSELKRSVLLQALAPWGDKRVNDFRLNPVAVIGRNKP
jgi:hypothetical protein